ncbi:MAG: hypothetical protein R2795_09115 [Saprospiraceae bacterium]
MKKVGTIIILCGWTLLSIAQSYTSYFTGNSNDMVSQPLGGVCLMGGASENENAMRWFAERAAGGMY